MRISEALRLLSQQLHYVSDAPELDAQRLLGFILHQAELSWLFTHSDVSLTASQEQLLMTLTERRAQGEPLAYLLGTQQFYGREFLVTPEVLIPRPTTEDLVDHALRAIDNLHAVYQRPLNIADIGTGSGCLAITLLLERPTSINQMFATDISTAALSVAQKNAAQFGVDNRIVFLHGSLVEPLVNNKIDLIVSNPPYVPTGELITPTGPEKRGLAYEPRVALDGGEDGQDYIAPLIQVGLPLVVESTGGLIQEFNFPFKK